MKRVLATAACLLAAAGAAGCGDEESEGSNGAELAGLAPAGAPVYAEAVVRPEGEQREDVDAVLAALLATEDPGGMIVDELDQEADGEVTFSDDILPWLGERAAFFASDFGGEGSEGIYAAIAETTDPEAADEANRSLIEASGATFEEKTYEGVDYLLDDSEGFPASGVVEGHFVGGTEEGFQAVVDAAAGESLADSGELPEDFAELGSETLLAAYAEPAAVLDALEESGELPAGQREAVETQLGIGMDEPVVVSAGAGESSVFVESVSGAAEGTVDSASQLLAELPADAWVAFAAADYGAALDATIESLDAQFETAPVVPPELRGGLEAAAERELGLDLRELSSWIGDIGFYFGGTSIFGLSGALIVETDDEQATLEALEPLRAELERVPELEISPLDVEGEGFEISIAGAPVQIPIVVRDGRLVAGFSEDSVEESFGSDEPLGDSEGFAAATDELGDGFDPAFYFDFEPMFELVESTGQPLGPEYEEAKPYLDALDFLVMGQTLDDDLVRARFALGVREGE